MLTRSLGQLWVYALARQHAPPSRSLTTTAICVAGHGKQASSSCFLGRRWSKMSNKLSTRIAACGAYLAAAPRLLIDSATNRKRQMRTGLDDYTLRGNALLYTSTLCDVANQRNCRLDETIGVVSMLRSLGQLENR